ncbi:hypothetical protein EJ08DRAFT_86218 [Tothia fuscella]|uniref:Secreted protein n=1 Tax=Tothia fuscella TaxID=1048955 RepID=A0A9P4NEL1_9PEZI|nr:hypothetical protein EJ08DRAFT_86218 [Tothia fuscella]
MMRIACSSHGGFAILLDMLLHVGLSGRVQPQLEMPARVAKNTDLLKCESASILNAIHDVLLYLVDSRHSHGFVPHTRLIGRDEVRTGSLLSTFGHARRNACLCVAKI